MGWAIALHGGAGVIPRDLPQENVQKVEDTLKNILQQGVSAIKACRSALDVVELVVNELENCPLFNAGRGSVFTAGETIEMEACIMDGPTRNCGCVSGLTTVVNPISLARLVMEKTPHIYLAFDGAEAFAREQGVKLADPEYFKTEQRLQQLHELKKMPSKANFSNSVGSSANGNQKFVGETVGCVVDDKDKKFVGETVGCVVVDMHGNCAAATSTGGRTNKMVGRIGDTPIVGAGTYANHLCAVSATGIGEYIIKATIGREVAAIMEYKGATLSEAANEVVNKRVDAGTTGLIAVSSTGDLAMPFNTTGMYRAAADENGHFEVGIWQ